MSGAMGYEVVVVGSLHMDIMIRAPGLPLLGETLAAAEWNPKPGGKGRNQAAEAALAGARTAMIGLVGDDAFGRDLVADLRSCGVDVSHVGIRAGARSGMSVAIVRPDGDYGAVIVSGANLELDRKCISDAGPVFRGANWLVLQNEVPDDANVAAADLAHRLGLRTILNAAPARRLPPMLDGLVDILVVNAVEAEAFSGTAVASLKDAARAAGHLLALADAAIVTAGAEGAAVAARSGLRSEISGHKVEVVSTHGAGDCFVGSLAACLAGGDDVDTAARRANSEAARRVASAADATGILPMPDRGT